MSVGNSTVVGDTPAALRKEQHATFITDEKKGAPAPQIPKIDNTFSFNNDDYLKERPFYVPIGKGGLIAALETLDQQLLQVGASSVVTHVQLTAFQFGRNTILSKKVGVVSGGSISSHSKFPSRLLRGVDGKSLQAGLV
jgi:hypothetical protein